MLRRGGVNDVPHGEEEDRCFVPTASGDAQAYVDEFHAAFAARDREPTDLPLFSRSR
ncbi:MULTISPECIES: hypothetical protein [unclassified Streptomyces]|uniref:hypothetical protein n=1 Tax=unclassified Streptomyces TaxID=2593676 RepID=UPI000367AE02|nr:hypothetical protein [Streptomyces sp. BoleA5]